MPVINRVAEYQADLTEWRRDIHMHPETAFEEHRTAALVAEKLESFGVEVHRGLAGTGVVGTLRAGDGSRRIGLRADMDALDILEATGLPHASKTPGKMHACGHDGHTTMLLGAAKYLAETKNFDGTVHFIFQPAEEAEGGGRVMVAEGLFEKFPVDAVYGLHNWPGMPVGTFAVREGPMMAAFDTFEINLKGRGAHAAMPHNGIDTVLMAAQLITSLQTIAARETDPLKSAVVTVTQVHGGDAWNVIPETVMLRGTTRTLDGAVQDQVEAAMNRIVQGVAATFGAEATLHYERRYPATVNHGRETDLAEAVARDLAGQEAVIRDPDPCMGAEDFAFMLNERPGTYVWMGNGPSDGNRLLHNPHYDFNDDALPWGVSYWVKLAETALAKAG